MKDQHILLVLSLIIVTITSAYVTPIWLINNNIDAGQVVVVNVLNMSTALSQPLSRTQTQKFNKTNFSVVPRVILSMIRYGNLPPANASCTFGIKTVILGTNLTNFNYTTTVQQVVIIALHYLYMAIQYEETSFYTDIKYLVFTPSDNLMNSTATQRYQSYVFANPSSMLNTNYAGQDIQFMAFPFGFNMLAQSGIISFSLNASLLNQSYYLVNVSTFGNNILYQIDFSLIAFNRGVITANYTVYIDIIMNQIIGNASNYTTSVPTASQYMYRNSLSGGIQIVYQASNFFAYYYNMSSQANDLIIWKAFNNRVRSCPSPFIYYQPDNMLCNDMCPTKYYTNTSTNICIPCHYSCNQCSSSDSNTSCSDCLSSENRTLINNTCLCNSGLYDDALSICRVCNYQCSTCYNGTNSSCLSCNSSLFRNFNTTLSTCDCIINYYQNITCLSCNSYALACVTCSYDPILSNFTCLTCNSSLFRTLSNDGKSCLCTNQYYENIANICVPCTVGCLICSYNGAAAICTSCDSTLMRVINANNLTCDCQPQYYHDINSTCTKCPLGCISCSYNGTSVICSSCDSSLNWTMGLSNLSCNCQTSYYINNASVCIACQRGCLSCELSGSSLLCSSCISSLFRTMGPSNMSCDCQPRYYQDINNTCSLCQLGCLNCLLNGSVLYCSICNSSLNRLLNSSNLSCDCQMGFYQDTSNICVTCQSGCLSCVLLNNIEICHTCSNGYYLSINNTCLSCSISGCLRCNSSSPNVSQFCQVCDSINQWIPSQSICICSVGYYQSNGNCLLNTPVSIASCGDCIKASSQQCDDGNTINGDGCSSTCSIEPYHACLNNASILQCTLCYYKYPISLSPLLIYKIPGRNSVQLEILLYAPGCNPNFLKSYLQFSNNLMLINKNRRLLSSSWISVTARSITYDPGTNTIIIFFDYNQTIDISTKYIQFSPSTSVNESHLVYFYNSQVVNMLLTTPYNKLATVYYNQDDLSLIQRMKSAFQALVVLYWIFMLVALIFKKGAIVMESMLILQLTYFTLLDQNQVLQSWSGLQLNGKYTYGYNGITFVDKSDRMDLKALQIDSNLPNTLNISVILIVLLFLSILCFQIYQFITSKRRIKQMKQQNNQQRMQKSKETLVERLFIYIIEIFTTLIFITTLPLLIVITFTQQQNLIVNLIQILIMATIIIPFWCLFYKKRNSHAWKYLSYNLLLNYERKRPQSWIRLINQHYYLIMYILLCISSMIISFLRTVGYIALLLIALSSIAIIIFQFRYKIYTQQLHVNRAIANLFILSAIMILKLVQFFLNFSLGIGLMITIAAYILLLALIILNTCIFIVTQYRNRINSRQQAHHEMQMKQMSNSLGQRLANVSYLGQDVTYSSIPQNAYLGNSINTNNFNNFEYSKAKEILQQDEYSSARSKLLGADDKKLSVIVESKIQQLKEFKRTVQTQGQITSYPNDVYQSVNLENILDELDSSKDFGNISNI